MFEFIRNFFNALFAKAGLSDAIAQNLGQSATIVVLILIAILIYYVSWTLMKRLFLPIIRKSKTQFDDILLKYKFFRKISYLIPTLFIYYFIEEIGITNEAQVGGFRNLLEAIFVIIFIMIINSLLSTLNDYYDRFDVSRDRPIKGVIQVAKIILYIFGMMAVISALFHRDITSILLSLGTISAVLMLIFKDPILGFVGGLQLVMNNMVRIGDWITMPKYGADGTILEITLTTVKVQNWDKTIVTIPTYSLISDSFQNWRGMEESGGRRIKRAVNIDMDSVTFCSPEMLARFQKIHAIKDYIEAKEIEIRDFNEKTGADPSMQLNGRRQTNLGVFRAYLKAYLRNRSDINMDLTFLVRHLPPSEKGLPIEIYVFTKTTEWALYENIQADIFDHILAAVPEFELRVFQFPTSNSLKNIL